MRWGIRQKVVAATVASVALTASAGVAVSVWQSDRLNDQTRENVRALVDEDLSRTATGVYDVVSTQGASTAVTLDQGIAVASYVLGQAGGMSVAPPRGPTVAWDAKNQFTSEVTPVTLPQVLVGGRWIGKNADVAVPTPVVDQVQQLVGGTATVFQRVNEAGDMLRVATNVVAASGSRAIGTFIPHVNADGSPNAVVSTVLGGTTYKGNAFVVDSWYVSAYTPLRDAAGTVIGMLYAGVKQENLPALRESLLQTSVGENGSVSVFGGAGTRRGTALIGTEVVPEGESALEATDADGTRWVEQVVDAAVDLQPGEQATVRYTDAETGGHTVKVTYYAPWDWVIAVDAQDSDFAAPVEALSAGQRSLITALVVSAVVLLALGLLGAWLLGIGLTRPLERLRRRMAEIADGEGDLTQRMDDSRADEFGDLAGTFNRFVDKVAGTVRDIGSCAQGLAASAAGVTAIAEDLRERAGQSRDRAIGAQRAAADISSGVSSAAAGAQQMGASIHEISRSASDAARVGQQGAELAERTQGTIAALGARSAEIGDVIRVIAGVAEQTNLLALNATIEAARAGDAGKGFAVVANEVKELAQQAARASEEIAERVQGIQEQTGAAVSAMEQISEVVRDINGHQITIAGAVEEQTATTAELTRNITSVADGATAVNGTLTDVSADAERSAQDVGRARAAAGELDHLSGELTRLLGVFSV
ncbi:HAMP domain-containing protein [Modestobacter sp. I12A-02628]|uniref:Methyl-accepting chemotaxis protein n=1 Tax=Goekera deserti TaxID=2497753 RepID=A0A7K3WCI0_9ACTN|nr:methyl-accepting chemotaxis protein [Goekera deserti]MPQ97674.1 HAMP domain-containing protein [Goekera deserti]NDI47659.1 HAMP domain-containing protein [Goekera deserti]NDI47722.1 HAMP domain-containing protein [Goekera deserti]NEL53470.1 methyl-accepting chemotaxis protein [Goekera deserti]